MYRLAPLLVPALALSDETSLMQSLKPQQITQKEDKSKAISNLLQSATQMLKNGATPDVVDFALATLAEITATVLPAIQNASDTDQVLVDTTYAMFDAASLELQTGNGRVNSATDTVDALSRRHRECRLEEQLACYNKLTCDQQICSIWEQCEDEEEILRQRSWEIERHFCDEHANGTTAIFRDHAEGVFPPFIEQWPIVQDWCVQRYPPKRQECEDLFSIMDEKTETCDPIKTELERAACAEANTIQEVRNSFADSWAYALMTYQRIINEVHCLEIDRWKEWRTLASVQCLLDRTTERNGRPCDESTDEISREITTCEERQHNESIDHLRITYHVVLTRPDPPVPPAIPCNAGFISHHYENPDLWDDSLGPWHLSEPPQAPFPESTPPASCPEPHHSHCNPWIECEPCVVIAEQPACYLLNGEHDPDSLLIYPEPAHECSNATSLQLQIGEFDRNGDGHFTFTTYSLGEYGDTGCRVGFEVWTVSECYAAHRALNLFADINPFDGASDYLPPHCSASSNPREGLVFNSNFQPAAPSNPGYRPICRN